MFINNSKRVKIILKVYYVGIENVNTRIWLKF